MKIPAQKCSAHNRRGGRCGRWAIAGGTVCFVHGGAAKQVKEAAALRLARLVDPAINILVREMKRPAPLRDVETRKLQTRCAHDALDRNGYGARQQLDVTQRSLNIDIRVLDEETIRMILALKERLSVAQLKKPEQEPV